MPRPPTGLSAVANVRERMLGAVDAEIFAEQASSLGRAGRALEQALADLAAFDAGTLKRRGRNPPDRPALLATAREAFWFLIVQREACGVRDASDVLSIYKVPGEVSFGVTLPRIGSRRR